MPVEQRHDDQLREHSGPQPLQGTEPAARRSRLRLAELDADHQAKPADVLDQIVLLGQATELGLQVGARAPGPADDVLVIEGAQRCEASHHGQLVAAESRRVLERILHRRVHASEDLLGGEHRADGHEAARQGLGDRDDVRLQAPVLMAEEPSGPAKPGLHLVHDQQGPVPAAELLSRAPVLTGCAVHALALNRLDDEGRHVAAAQLPLERIDVPERHGLALQQLAKALAEFLAAVEGQGTGRQTVKRVLRIENLRPLRRMPGEFDCGLNGLGAGVAEEDTADTRMGASDKLLGQQPGQQRAVHLDHVGQVEVERLMEGRLDCRMTPAQGINPETGQEVEVALAGVVVEVAAVAPDVVAVEPESPERPGELGVHVPLMQGKVLPGTLCERSGHIEGHAAPQAALLIIGRLRLRHRRLTSQPVVDHPRASRYKLACLPAELPVADGHSRPGTPTLGELATAADGAGKVRRVQQSAVLPSSRFCRAVLGYGPTASHSRTSAAFRAGL